MIRFLLSLRAAFCLVLVMTLLLGGVYPFAVMGLAQAFFSSEANGSLIERGGTLYGSRLIGQQFESPRYFWGRLSALPKPYDPAHSGGSNLGPASPVLKERAHARLAALQKHDGRKKAAPGDLLTASASGLDPHISLAAALYQLPRVAKARGLKEEEVQRLLAKNTKIPFLGASDIQYVNIVTLNLALDELDEVKKK